MFYLADLSKTTPQNRNVTEWDVVDWKTPLYPVLDTGLAREKYWNDYQNFYPAYDEVKWKNWESEKVKREIKVIWIDSDEKVPEISDLEMRDLLDNAWIKELWSLSVVYSK